MRIHRVLILVFVLALASGSAGAAQQFELSRKDIETEGHPSRGPVNAPVTIVEFGDFECPFCGGLHPTLQAVRRNYPDQVRIVFRQFPLIFTHQYAQKAAEASLCAHEQDRFWEFHDSLFENQEDIDVPALKRRAVEFGLDTARFDECLDSGEKWADAEADIEEGVNAAVFSTPTMFINGLIMEGSHPYQNIVEVIESELERIESGR